MPGIVVKHHGEDIFGRQRRHRTLQPAAIERVIRIGSKCQNAHWENQNG